jgi:N-acylneuraminate cytidylyltransferase
MGVPKGLDKAVYGFMPLRSGSKGIPGKNWANLAGKPLCMWGLSQLCKVDSKLVYAAVEDLEGEYFEGVWMFVRSPESATDDESPEVVINEWIEAISKEPQHEPPDDAIFLYTQATNPWVTADDFKRAIELLQKADDPDGYVVGAAKITPYVYRQAGAHFEPYPMFDTKDRGNRQESKPFLKENGSIYCTTIGALKRNGTHKGKLVGIVEMPEYTALEIDEPHHLVMARALCEHYQCTPTQIRRHIR